MEIFIPESGSNNAIIFPAPSVEPVDVNGDVLRADVIAKRAHIVIDPHPDIHQGDAVTYRQHSPGVGTWVGQHTVEDATVSLKILVRTPVGAHMDLRYFVSRPDGTSAGESATRTYRVV